MEQYDELSKWVKVNIGNALKLPEENEFEFVATKIMAEYESKFSNWFTLDDPNGIEVDPFLVAFAATRNLIVVTGESKKTMQPWVPY